MGGRRLGLAGCADPASLLGLSPARVRELGAPALETLAADIRSFLVSAVSENGGHLGSNLGVVELTLALHRVFRFAAGPDRVGHRASDLCPQDPHRTGG